MSYDPSKPPLIAETLLKNRRSLEHLALIRSVIVPDLRRKKRSIRGEDIRIKRPERYTAEYNIREGSLNKVKRVKREVSIRKKPILKKVEMKSTVGFMVRIHQAKHSNVEIKRELKKLGLEKKYDGSFVRLDAETLSKLKPLNSYIAYGYLSNQSVVDLIHRRAYTHVQGPRRPLTDNVTVEKLLSSKGILCLNDLCHEIYNVGPNFDEAKNILCSFQLSAPVGTFEKNILAIHDEVEKKAGFIGDDIEDFVKKIV